MYFTMGTSMFLAVINAHLFFFHQNGDEVQFLCKCSFLEIYNEQVFDLLDPASVGLHLRENIKRGVFVDGLIEEPVGTASEAYQVWLICTLLCTI